MLEKPQEPVVERELRRFDTADVALLRKGDQRRKGRDLPDVVVGLPVYKLQQLDGELDVAQSAGPELQLHVEFTARDVCCHPFAHALHRFDEILARRTRPHHRSKGIDVALAEFAVTRERPRL